jgi:hypothetical protein
MYKTVGVLLFATICGFAHAEGFALSEKQTKLPAHHTQHVDAFGDGAAGLPFNLAVLRAVDKVQASAPDGGGYFIGVHAKPPESPIGYELNLFGKAILSPPRTTSYCSGSAYSAFIEALNLIFPDESNRHQLSPERLEGLRMQEPDGSRREGDVKAWGYWNADGFGTQFCLVQYLGGAGREIKPDELRPGDFMNISWKSGLGHSVVFLGFCTDDKGRKCVRYWSSQTGTNGLGDQTTPIEKVKEVKAMRLTNPEKIFTYDPASKVNLKVPGDPLQ